MFQDFLGVGYHGTEFVAVKFFSVFSDAAVFEDDRSRGVVIDPEGDGEKDRRNTDAADYGEDDIKDAFHNFDKNCRCHQINLKSPMIYLVYFHHHLG